MRTFDNVTLSLKTASKSDQYVLVRHNSDEPDFYVLDEFQGDVQVSAALSLPTKTKTKFHLPD